MARVQGFLARVIDHSTQRGGHSSDNSSDKLIAVSVFSNTLAELEEYVRNNDLCALKNALQEEFVHEEVIRRETVERLNTFPKQKYHFYRIEGQQHIIKDPNSGCGVYRASVYEFHMTESNLETLYFRNHGLYQKLLKMASPECAVALRDFSNLDLSMQDFAMKDTMDLNFSGCILLNVTNLSQDQLDQASTYESAQLPEPYIPFWSCEKKQGVLASLEKLEQYAKQLKSLNDLDAHEKADKLRRLASELKSRINNTSKYNGDFQKKFLQTLHSQDSILTKRRYHSAKTIIINTSLFILGLGVGYLAAGLIHKAATNRFLFYSRSETKSRLDETEKFVRSARA